MAFWIKAGILFAAGLPVWAATTIVLGQPTDRSISVSMRSDTALEVYVEFGVKSGTYSGQTKAVSTSPDPFVNGFFVTRSVISGLQGDTQYYYRLQSRPAGSNGAFTPGSEYGFHTQRAPGSTFVFGVQGDSHPEREKTMFDGNLYRQTLAAVAAAKPDFYITSGDDFSVDTLQTPYTQTAVANRYAIQLPYLDVLSRTGALFLGTGNHEETSLSNYNLPADSANSNQVPIWAQNARNLYYPMPAPNDPDTGTFYTGNTTNVPKIGLLRDYYAWEWGDALFVVIDPYWSSPVQVDTGLGGQNSTTPKAQNKWDITHGDQQYQWLKRALEQSKAKWKFVFAHHVMGTGRGGVEIANQFEWGGNSANGAYAFPQNRPSWPQPIHQLMVANHVTVFFQAHDHLFARQQLDGVVYQSLPNPADNTYTAFNADAYTSGDVYPNAGFAKVTVGPSNVKVEYIRQWLPADEKPPAQVSGAVQFAYTIGSPPTPVIASVAAAGGGSSIAPNTWIEIKGSNLAPAGTARIWRASDFVNNQLPRQLDGVSVMVNGKPAFVYYVSPTQVNALSPPDALPGTVPVVVSVDGIPSAESRIPARAAAPALLTFSGTDYAAATHADGSLIGPTSLYPGASSPARPGESVVLYGSGFGPTSTPVNAGSPAQSGTLNPLPAVQVGGLSATVQFAGLISPGLFQFNVLVPAAATDGDLPVRINSGGASIPTGVLLTVKK